MLFSVIFKDKTDSADLRKMHLAAHIKWLDFHQSEILVGGSLRYELAQSPIGGLWIVEADSKKMVLDLIETDPFWTVGLRQSVEVLHWSKAFEDRKSLI